MSLVRAKTPERLGKYRLLEEVASGGMGAIYAGLFETPAGDRRVAIKVMHPHLSKVEQYRRMFFDEARVIAGIHHPNVVTILDFGTIDGVDFMVMEWMDSVTLGRVAIDGHRADTLPMWLVLRVIADAARGLHAAHELRDEQGASREIIHRDVSPGNVMVLRSGTAKIIDFGVASASDRLSETTRTGEIKGKVAYMAPEQLRGDDMDRRADVWSLGVLLWEGLAGRRLFRRKGATDAATMHDVLYEDVPEPSWRGEPLPDAIRDVVMSALARDPAERTPNAATVADALERFLYARGEPCGPSQVAAWIERNVAPARDWSTMTPSLSRAGEVSEIGPLGAHEAKQVAPPRTGRRRIAAVVAAVVLLSAASVAFYVARGGGDVSVTIHAPVETPAIEPVALEVPAIEPVALEVPAIEPVALEVPAEATTVESPVVAMSESVAPRMNEPREARAPGRLNVVAIPPASVSVRGRSLGQTPLAAVSLPAGRHTLVLHWEDGSRKTVSVRIQPGETSRVGPIRRDS